MTNYFRTSYRNRPVDGGPRIAIYIAAVLGLGWLGPVIDQAVGTDNNGGPGQLFWLLLPIGAAMLLRWRTSDGFADAGLRPHYRANRRWYDLSSAFYPIAMLTAIGGGIAVDHWDLYDDRSPLRFAAAAAVALIPFTFAAIAEEFGWRGYMTPRLEAAGVGRLANHTIVGVVWGAWHLPYMAAAWDYSTESLWTVAPRVFLGTTAIAVVYGEIRLRTGSVWPAVIMHASGNAVAGALINTDNVLVQNEPAPWLFVPGVDGVVVIAISAALAAILFVRRPPTNPSDVTLDVASTWEFTPPADHDVAFIYTQVGTVETGGTTVAPRTMAMFGSRGNTIVVTADQTASFVIGTAPANHQPIVASRGSMHTDYAPRRSERC